jgi:Anti-sigma-K factor rskA
MNETHERIEELLAGYALRALSGADAEEAERLLTEHVPACGRCREALTDFQALAGELALAAPAATPPEELEARIRRDVEEGRPTALRRRSVAVWAAGVAAAVLLVGLAGWNTVLAQRVTRAEDFQAAMTSAVFTANDPRAETLPLDHDSNDETYLYLVYLPDEEKMYLVGKGIPEPTGGHLYWVWLGRNRVWTPVRWFLPKDGLVALEMPGNPVGYEAVWICEELEGRAGDDPSDPLWAAEV